MPGYNGYRLGRKRDHTQQVTRRFVPGKVSHLACDPLALELSVTLMLTRRLRAWRRITKPQSRLNEIIPGCAGRSSNPWERWSSAAKHISADRFRGRYPKHQQFAMKMRRSPTAGLAVRAPIQGSSLRVSASRELDDL